MEIYLKEFRKKFYIKASNKNMRATYDLQLSMAKASDIEDKEPFEQIQATMEMTEKVQEYIIGVLRLGDEQKKFLNEQMENKETIELANHLAMRLMGISEKEIAKQAKEQGSDAEKKA